MKSAEKIERLVKKMRFSPDASANKRILDYAESALKQRIDKAKSNRFELNIWSTIMKKPITKIAAAAAVILIAVLAITFLDKAVTPAWAIEQTIDVLKQFNAIHVLGTMLDEQGKETSFEAWLTANKEQTASDNFKLETETGQIAVVSENRYYQYDPQTQIVKITEGYGPAMSPWPGAKMLEFLRKCTLDWQETYGKNPATNRDCVFVTCSHPAAPDPRSWWLEFDVESKLLISFKQWDNMTWQGTPSYYARSITYLADLPDELFHFEIPEGAKTVIQTPELMWKLDDPNAGMPITNMTEDKACKEIARCYWQAIIDHDWDTVAKLRPVATAEQWKLKYTSNFVEIVEIGQPYQEEGCKLGKIVPCSIRCENNNLVKINMVIMFREINGQRSCVIAGTWGADLN
jgi:outer membrane lipoprotein-sorting protein